ncbi:DNA methyltransferase [Priestia megaterium]|uniref:DNA methyltransferase n=1 Tax=Priestia megaterium TaxID=1404 RepID=UPI0039FC6706
MKEHEQLSFLNEDTQADNGPVVCLGLTFKNDAERREYFRNELRRKLPELKQGEGFPIGEDEDIIALSDPPYYTACPNPWINNFIEEWEREKVEKYGRGANETYRCEPFASDVSEGKNDAIYNAHSYHTKTPHKAIMRYILNYTKPGDIVFDGFCGTGMTGVAAQLCADRKEVESLGFRVVDHGTIQREIEGEDVKEIWEDFSKLGARRSILTDLSPAATFISYNFNSKANIRSFESVGKSLLDKLMLDYRWMFFTLKNDSSINKNNFAKEIRNLSDIEEVKELLYRNENAFGKVNYVVWSEVYSCSNCTEEIVFSEAALDKDKKAKEQFPCPKCNAEVKKKDLDKVKEYKYDYRLNKAIKHAKRIPVLINYSLGAKRYEKTPDELDIELMKKMDELVVPDWYPTNLMMNKGEKWGDTWRAGYHSGIKQVNDFFPDRALVVLSDFIKLLRDVEDHEVKQNMYFLHGSVLPKLTILNRYMPQHGSRALVGPMTNTLYVPPLSVENNVLNQLNFQFKKIMKALNEFSGNIISSQSSTNLDIRDNSIDYIFLDPPFGANIMYSELNFIRESWLKVLTNNSQEAIENKTQEKSLLEYQELITNCFKEAYRILKPGRWITIEFSNTQAKVWNVIQHSLHEVGFVIASVDALSKTRGGLHSMIGTIAVKQDLIISAYKPNRELRLNIISDSSLEIEMWNFVNSHLEFLPVFKGDKGQVDFIHERDPRILYDRVVAYFVRNGFQLQVSSQDFQNSLRIRFPMRDGMVFLESQVAEYDRKRLRIIEFSQMNLFVIDETSAIEWLRQQLMKKPKTRQELHPNFMKEIQHIAKHEMLPELDDLLHQNFLKYEGEEAVPEQVASYLRKNYKDLRGLENDDVNLKEKALNRWYVPDPNKQADLEKLREKSLLREFDGYLVEIEQSKKKMKQFRTEAIRAGFKKAWSEKDYEKIVKVGERLPESVIQEDDKLLMYFDNAQIRLGL